VLSEFLLIAIWTWFKAPDDFFSIYNSLPIRKFSIFQRMSSVKGSGTHSDPNKKNQNLPTGGNYGRRETTDIDNEDGHRFRDSLLSDDNLLLHGDDDYRNKSTLDKRSI
jgi:hypothetical protein